MMQSYALLARINVFLFLVRAMPYISVPVSLFFLSFSMNAVELKSRVCVYLLRNTVCHHLRRTTSHFIIYIKHTLTVRTIEVSNNKGSGKAKFRCGRIEWKIHIIANNVHYSKTNDYSVLF